MNLKQILSAALALLSFGAVQAEKTVNTIGTIVYKVDNIDREFKFLRDNGFTSCEVQWYYDKATPELARQIKEASKKTQYQGNDPCGCARTQRMELH